MTISCIGTGAMGGAIMRAVCKKFYKKQIKVTDKNAEMGKKFAKENGCTFVETNKEALAAKYIFLAVKPQFLGDVFDEIKDDIGAESVVISMAAGVKIEKLQSYAPNARFVRNLYERTWSKAAIRSQMDGLDTIRIASEDFRAAAAENEFSEKLMTKHTLGFI